MSNFFNIYPLPLIEKDRNKAKTALVSKDSSVFQAIVWLLRFWSFLTDVDHILRIQTMINLVIFSRTIDKNLTGYRIYN